MTNMTLLQNGDYYKTSGKERGRLILQAASIMTEDGYIIRQMVEEQIKNNVNPITICELGGSSLITRESIFEMINNIALEKGITISFYNFEHNIEEVKKAEERFGQSGEVKYSNLIIRSVACDLSKTPGNEILSLMGGQKADILLSNYCIQHIGNGRERDEATKIKDWALGQVPLYTSDSAGIFIRCPEDLYKTSTPGLGFSDPEARAAAIALVDLFTTNFTRGADRHYGNRVSDILNGSRNNYCDRLIATVSVDNMSATEEQRVGYLKRDFKWYAYVFEEKYEETKAEEDKKLLDEAWRLYHIIEDRFAKQGLGVYVYGEPLTLDNRTLQLVSSIDANKTK